jgi:hypothetical protein
MTRIITGFRGGIGRTCWRPGPMRMPPDLSWMPRSASMRRRSPSILITFWRARPTIRCPRSRRLLRSVCRSSARAAIEAGRAVGVERVSRAVLAYRLRSREATRDVDVALHRLVASRGLVQELSTQVRVAQSAVELAEAAYAAGLGTNLERVVAQDDLLNAELQRVVAEFDLKIASLELQRACGASESSRVGVAAASSSTRGQARPDSPVLDRPQLSETPPNASGDRP